MYSRDLLSPISLELNLVLTAIRTGAFCPDSTRSGMLTPGALPYMGGTPLPVFAAGAPATPVPDLVKKAMAESTGDKSRVSDTDEGFSFVNMPEPEADLFGGSSVPSPSIALDNAEQDNLSETTEENSVQSSSESETGEACEEHRSFM